MMALATLVSRKSTKVAPHCMIRLRLARPVSMPMTVAPAQRAYWTAYWPRPPPAPMTARVLPGFRSALRTAYTGSTSQREERTGIEQKPVPKTFLALYRLEARNLSTSCNSCLCYDCRDSIFWLQQACGETRRQLFCVCPILLLGESGNKYKCADLVSSQACTECWRSQHWVGILWQDGQVSGIEAHILLESAILMMQVIGRREVANTLTVLLFASEAVVAAPTDARAEADAHQCS